MTTRTRTYLARRLDNNCEPVSGRPVRIPGWEEFEFFVHRPLSDSTDGWAVSEVRTGCKIVTVYGWSQKTVLIIARNTLNRMGRTALEDAIATRGAIA